MREFAPAQRLDHNAAGCVGVILPYVRTVCGVPALPATVPLILKQPLRLARDALAECFAAGIKTVEFTQHFLLRGTRARQPFRQINAESLQANGFGCGCGSGRRRRCALPLAQHGFAQGRSGEGDRRAVFQCALDHGPAGIADQMVLHRPGSRCCRFGRGLTVASDRALVITADAEYLQDPARERTVAPAGRRGCGGRWRRVRLVGRWLFQRVALRSEDGAEVGSMLSVTLSQRR